jgi:alpha-tubulin suppressor-like RCC1 family protein/predicted peptidase
MKAIAINKVTVDGEKNIAVMVEYDKQIDSNSLSASTFSVEGRTVTNVCICPGGSGATIELDFSARETTTLSMKMGDPRTHYVPSYGIKQERDMLYADGSVAFAWTEPLHVTEMRDKEYDKFQKLRYVGKNGVSLAYALFVPEGYDSSKGYPLIAYWHGGPEKGDDNVRSMLFSQNGVIWATDEEQTKHQCFILVPQCPKEYDWIDPDTYERTPVFDAVCDLLMDMIEKYSIDPSRIYNTGFSMGAMCAWDIAKRYPKLFAATAIYVGQFCYDGIEVLKDNNIWVFHAEDDSKSTSGNIDTMDTFKAAGADVNLALWDGMLRGKEAEEICRAQIAKGGKIKHTLFKEGMPNNHNHGWVPAISNEVFRNWVFAQVNDSPSAEENKSEIASIHCPVRLDIDGSGIAQISAGARHNVLLKTNGTVTTWGFNGSGQLGEGLSGLKDIVSVAAGNNFSLAANAKGEVFAWGSNCLCQLGSEDTERVFAIPVKINGIENAAKVFAGDNYAVALTKDGKLYSWGNNSNYQLGTGDNKRSATPGLVPASESDSSPLAGVIDVVAGVRTVACVLDDGTARIWGDGEYGQVGKGFARFGASSKFPFSPIDVNSADGTFGDVLQVALGRCHTAILKKDGTVWTWGLHRHGELGIGKGERPDKEGKPVDTAFSAVFVNAAKVDIDSVVSIGAGMSHSVALKSDGTVRTWGYNKMMSSGALGVGDMAQSDIPVVPPLENIARVFTGLNHSFALGRDGDVWAWGNNNNNRITV